MQTGKEAKARYPSYQIKGEVALKKKLNYDYIGRKRVSEDPTMNGQPDQHLRKMVAPFNNGKLKPKRKWKGSKEKEAE